MYSDSLLEIGITGIGWEFYSKIIMLIVALNLHLLPFAYMIIRNWWETSRSQDAGFAAVTELKRTSSDFLVMAIVMLLFWYPMPQTSYNSASYVAATDQAKDLYQKINPQSSSVPVPIGWYGLMLVTKATTNQIIAWTQFDNKAQTMLHAMNTMRIKDRDLQYQTDAFASACYYSVLNRWQYETKTPFPQPAGNAVSDQITYIGNNVFMNTKGYYRTCNQSDMNSGMCYGSSAKMPPEVASRFNIRYEQPVTFIDRHTGQNKTIIAQNPPSCHTWWTGNADHDYDISGLPAGYTPLRAALLQNAKDYFDEHPFIFNLSTEKEDELINRLLKNDPPKLAAQDRDWSEMGLWDMLKNGLFVVIGAIGGTIMALLLSVAIDVLKPLLYMLQSLAIFGVILSLSITLLIGVYRPEVVLKHAGFLFAILLLPLFWHAADYLNEGLLRILYPQYASGSTALVLNEGVSAILYFIFILLAYLALPGYFIKMMGQAGAEAADVAGDAMNISNSIMKKGVGGAATGIRNTASVLNKK